MSALAGVSVPEVAPGLAVISEAVSEHGPSQLYALFSGGHDSVCSTFIAAQHPLFGGVVHLNTGRGIKRTRQYVEETCQHYGWPLTVMNAPEGEYERLVRKRGFPGGPKSHNSMYYYLKQRQIATFVREHKRNAKDRIGFVTGIRTSESLRRAAAKMSQAAYERRGASVWAKPILTWTALDVTRFMAQHDIARNPVVVKCHRSGECLCGALANPRELSYIELWYPEDVAPIRALERECAALGLPAKWGYRVPPNTAVPGQGTLPGFLCSSCVSEAAA